MSAMAAILFHQRIPQSLPFSKPGYTHHQFIMTKDIDDVPEVMEMDSVKQQMNYDLVDREVAEYANTTIVEIDDATNRRLKRLIDKRVMLVMVVTYLIQTLDKGTMSYASIMGIQEDTNLVGQQVRFPAFISSKNA